MSQLSHSQIISEVDEYTVLYTSEPHKRRPKYHDGFLKHYKYNSKFQVLSSSNVVISSQFKLGYVVNKGDEFKVGSVLVHVEYLKSREERDITNAIGKGSINTTKSVPSTIKPVNDHNLTPKMAPSSTVNNSVGMKRRRVGLSKTATPSKRLTGVTQMLRNHLPAPSITSSPNISSECTHLVKLRNMTSKVEADTNTKDRTSVQPFIRTLHRSLHSPQNSKYPLQNSDFIGSRSSNDNHDDTLTYRFNKEDGKSQEFRCTKIPTDLSNLLKVVPERPKLRTLRSPRYDVIKNKETNISENSVARPIKITEIAKDDNASNRIINSRAHVPLSKMISSLTNQLAPVKSVFETFGGVESPSFNSKKSNLNSSDEDDDSYDVYWQEDSRRKDSHQKSKLALNTPAKTHSKNMDTVRDSLFSGDNEDDKIIATPPLELHREEVVIKTKTYDYKMGNGTGKVYRISEL